MRILLQAILTLITIIILSDFTLAAQLKIGLIPEQNVFQQFNRYKPLGEYIEKKTNIKIKFTVLSMYGNIVESFNEKNLDGAFWGSFTGAMANRKLGIEFIARPVAPDGTASHRGYVFVHRFSIIDNVDRMKNTVIAFVDKATTTGYVFPLAYFGEHGVKDIDSYFKDYYFTGSHEAAIYAVLNKEAEIGCAKNTVFDLLAKDDPRVKNDLVILAESPDVPSYGLGLKKDISPEIKQKIQEVLLGMDRDPEGKKVLDEFGAVRFTEAAEKDYLQVFDFAREAGIDLKSYKYFNK